MGDCLGTPGTVSFKKTKLNGGARVVMIILARNGHGDTSSNPVHSTNTLGKGMNPIILPPAMGK